MMVSSARGGLMDKAKTARWSVVMTITNLCRRLATAIPSKAIPSMHLSRPVCLAAVVLMTVISARALSREPSRPALLQAANVGGEYAGSDTCVVCHADQGRHFQNTVMGKAFA